MCQIKKKKTVVFNPYFVILIIFSLTVLIKYLHSKLKIKVKINFLPNLLVPLLFELSYIYKTHYKMAVR